MRVSILGNPFNTDSMTAALVLQHLYYLPNQGEIEISMREMARELKISNRSISRVLDRMSSWSFLVKKTHLGKKLKVSLNRYVIDQALKVSKNTLLSQQQEIGFIPSF